MLLAVDLTTIFVADDGGDTGYRHAAVNYGGHNGYRHGSLLELYIDTYI
jgi:hypothetical protein